MVDITKKIKPNQTRWPDLMLISKKKRTRHLVNFSVPADYRVKIQESEEIDKCLDVFRELKKTVEHERDGGTNCSYYPWNSPKKLRKRREELETRGGIVKICWNSGFHWSLSDNKFPKISETFLNILLWLVGCLIGFYGISTFVGYLTTNPSYIHICIWFGLVGFMAYQHFLLISRQIVFIHIYQIYDL